MKILRNIILFILILGSGLYGYLLSMTPSLNKNWEIDQKILTDIEINEASISMKNIRSFRYSGVDTYEVKYFDDEYNLHDIASLDYIIEPFGEIDGFAHTMLSFGFSDGRYLSISAEIRKEVGESFHPVSGVLNAYEIVYIIGDEEDLIKLRANHRKDTVILYPISASKEKIQQLFVSVIQRADSLSKKAEFYNSITNTCSTSIFNHLNELRINNNKSPLDWGKTVFLPSHSDEIAYDLGLIDTNLTLPKAREYYTINNISLGHQVGENYSELIRKEIK